MPPARLLRLFQPGRGFRPLLAPPCIIAMIYLGLGERDHALAWLEQGRNARDVWAHNLKGDPIYADLRTEPRFAALLRRVGLEQ